MKSNLPVVNVEQFTSIVEMQLEEGNTRPIFGLGKGGIGKTESIANLAKKLGVGYVDIRLLLYTEVDLKGIPYPDENHKNTIWLQNSILPTEKDGERGILVLDEITSTARSVRTAAYQLLNERRLGEYELPKGWIIVCLGNGEEDGGDFQGMEGNFLNRCSVFNVVPNIDAWKDWALSSGINPLVLGYISWRNNDLHTFNPDDEDNMLFASPRSWKAVSDVLNARKEIDSLTELRVLSNVGTEVGHKFLAFCKYKDSAIEPMDILSGKDKICEETRLEVIHMTIQSLISLMTESINADKTNKGLIELDTLQRVANGVRWILSISKVEIKVMAIKDFINTDRATVGKVILNSKFLELCPEMGVFASENRQVFKATGV